MRRGRRILQVGTSELRSDWQAKAPAPPRLTGRCACSTWVLLRPPHCGGCRLQRDRHNSFFNAPVAAIVEPHRRRRTRRRQPLSYPGSTPRNRLPALVPCIAPPARRFPGRTRLPRGGARYRDAAAVGRPCQRGDRALLPGEFAEQRGVVGDLHILRAIHHICHGTRRPRRSPQSPSTDAARWQSIRRAAG